MKPGAAWGTGDEKTRVVRVDVGRGLDSSGGRSPRKGELRKPKPGQFTQLLFRKELDGPVGETGKKMWKTLIQAVPALETQLEGSTSLEQVRYSDRYVVAPLPMRVLLEVLTALRGRPGGIAPTTAVSVTVMEANNERQPVRVDHNFPNHLVQKNVLGLLLREVGRVTVTVLPRRDTARARELVLLWPDAQFTLRLDQGLGFLKSIGHAPHPFGARDEKQAADLRTATFRVGSENLGGVPAYYEGPTARPR